MRSGRLRSASARNACSRRSSPRPARCCPASCSRGFAPSRSRRASPLVLAILILLLLVRTAYLKRCINDGMRELWAPPTASCAVNRRRQEAQTARAAESTGFARTRAYQKFFQALKWRIFPGVFGFTVLVGAFVLAAIIILIGAQRAEIAWSERQNKYCQLTSAPVEVVETTGPVAKPFKTDDKCWASGVSVTKGERYLVTLRVTQPWIDRTIPTSPAGFESSRLRWYVAAVGPAAALAERALVPADAEDRFVARARRTHRDARHALQLRRRAGLQHGVRGGAQRRSAAVRE